MSNSVKKVIRASAGTGKTYRLSLEYIALLLRFRRLGIQFNEILVITFTKKATAEIRDRIFAHLKSLTQNSDSQAAQALHQNLLAFGIQLADFDIDYLQTIYREMLKNKDRVQISTIDSFTNTIFHSMIAPVMGMTHYEIDEEIRQQNLSEISEYLLRDPSHLALIKKFLQQGAQRNIQAYEKLIHSIIDKRWIFHFIDDAGIRRSDGRIAATELDKMYDFFSATYLQIIDRLVQYLHEEQNDSPAGALLTADFYALLQNRTGDVQECLQAFKQMVQDPQTAQPFFNLVLAKRTFWHGGRLLRKKKDAELKEELIQKIAKAAGDLGDYLLFSCVFPEQEILFELADRVLAKYDEIKTRDRIFTHSDISYYTFRHLYDPELSLIDQDRVTNSFYEYLTNRIRFVLIDEFQDTSVLQLKILQPIINEVTSGIGARPYGGAIVVGDEKQSIYEWRGGERDLLLRMPAILQSDEVSSLDTSFRSSFMLIDFFNQLFSDAVFHEQLNQRGIEWQYQQIKAFRQNDPGSAEVHLRGFGKAAEQVSKHEVLHEYVQKVVLPKVTDPRVAGNTAILTRKNSDLQEIAAILDEERIDYVLDSSKSILEHRMIRPLLHLFRFLVYRQMIDLLRFLRSDAVLLDSDSLKALSIAYRDWQSQGQPECWIDFLRSVAGIPFISIVLQIVEESVAVLDISDRSARAPQVGSRTVLSFVHTVIEQLAMIALFDQENDIKNLHAFLERIAAFEQRTGDYDPNLEGFLHYCEENKKHREFAQQGLESVQMVQLMTIHKAKGLEFDNVFLYLDLSSHAGSDYGRLQSYLIYDQQYRGVQDYLLTYHYDAIVQNSMKRTLVEESERRGQIESLNALYVAMTRARFNLVVLAAVDSKNLADWLQTEDDEKKIERLLLRRLAALLLEQDAVTWESDSYLRGQLGEYTFAAVEKPTETVAAPSAAPNIARYIDFDRHRLRSAVTAKFDYDKYPDYHTAARININAIKGNVIHYYLSFVRHDSEPIRRWAAGRTFAYYGNLLPKQEIDLLVARANHLIDANNDLFSIAQWPQVFTEWAMIDPEGREVRLDRLMVNPDHKEVLIVDFKTGEAYEEEQIGHYVETVRALDFVQQNGYICRGRFVEVGEI